MTAEKFTGEIQSTAEVFFKSIAVDIYQDAGILCVVTGIDNNFLNAVLHVNVGEDQLEERIYTARNFFSSHQVPWTWCVNPLDQPGNIGYLLKSHGFVGLESAPVMVCDLKNYSPTKSRLSIKEVFSLHDFQDWGKSLLEGFQSTAENCAQFVALNQNLRSKEADFYHFVAYHENEPVSSVTLSVSSYGARIDNLATRTAFLRQGFGAEMVRCAMTKAKNLGYSWCCLESSRKGVPLYQQLGFREIYRVKTYG